jgi:hypothetical protein
MPERIPAYEASFGTWGVTQCGHNQSNVPVREKSRLAYRNNVACRRGALNAAGTHIIFLQRRRNHYGNGKE